MVRRGQAAIEQVKATTQSTSFAAHRQKPDDKRYVLALAQALALKRDDDAARSALITLRESAPEDPEINLQLARLAATRQDVTEALRFYHNALYAPWPSEQADARRRVRFELIRFLLTHDQVSRALSELLALSTDLPDEVPLRLEVAQLFAKAGDNGHALDQFKRALHLAPENGEALAGAGQARSSLPTMGSPDLSAPRAGRSGRVTKTRTWWTCAVERSAGQSSRLRRAARRLVPTSPMHNSALTRVWSCAPRSAIQRRAGPSE